MLYAYMRNNSECYLSIWISPNRGQRYEIILRLQKNLRKLLYMPFSISLSPNDLTELVHGVASLDTAFQILLELMSSIDFVHQIPIFLKNSSLLSYEFTRPSFASSNDFS